VKFFILTLRLVPLGQLPRGSFLDREPDYSRIADPPLLAFPFRGLDQIVREGLLGKSLRDIPVILAPWPVFPKVLYKEREVNAVLLHRLQSSEDET